MRVTSPYLLRTLTSRTRASSWGGAWRGTDQTLSAACPTPWPPAEPQAALRPWAGLGGLPGRQWVAHTLQALPLDKPQSPLEAPTGDLEVFLGLQLLQIQSRKNPPRSYCFLPQPNLAGHQNNPKQTLGAVGAGDFAGGELDCTFQTNSSVC